MKSNDVRTPTDRPLRHPPGNEGEVKSLIDRLAEASTTEPGNLGFEPYVHLTDPRKIVLLERYADVGALAAHRETPHLQKLVLDKIVPQLESRVLKTFTVDTETGVKAMDTTTNRYTDAFRNLHVGAGPLILPNAWDVGSALGYLAAGFPAIGTTSFGLAASAGSPDGGRSTRAATVELTTTLRSLPVPISADIEDGYSDDPAEVAALVVELRIAGVNLEDSTHERLVAPESHAAKIAAIKAADPDVFVNARIDTYWLGQSADTEETLRRAWAYIAAGADGIFVPALAEPSQIRTITEAASVPVNLLPVPGRSVAELADLGVRRLSTGSLPYRAAIDAAVNAATSLRDGLPPVQATPYQEAQQRLVAYQQGK